LCCIDIVKGLTGYRPYVFTLRAFFCQVIALPQGMSSQSIDLLCYQFGYNVPK